MFYSDDLLTSKNGAFGVIWLAATLGIRTKKITKRDLNTVDLPKTCDLIAQPPEPMALRLSGNLLVGVARVYNQNYEVFYSDVTQFHSTLRRCLAFETASAAGGVGVANLDLPGEGKGRYDQITFGDLDVSWQSVLNTDFGGIDWRDPLKKRSRREESVLASQPSKSSKSGEHDDEEEEEKDDDEDDDPENPRAKRPRVTPSESLGPKKTWMPGSSQQHLPVFEPDTSFGDLPADFAIFDDFPAGGVLDSSIDLPMDHAEELDLLNALDAEAIPPVANTTIEDQEAVQSQKVVKRRSQKKLCADQEIEMSNQETQEQTYRATMDATNAANASRDQEKAVSVLAKSMVDGAGNWAYFFHPEMQEFFAAVTKAGTYKWEAEVLAHRAGQKWTPGPQIPTDNRDEPRLEIGNDTFDTFVPGDFDIPMDDIPVPDDQDLPPGSRIRSASVERPRAMSQRRQNQPMSQPMPWEAPRTGGQDDTDIAPGRFSSNALRLSIMTPQEIRIRRNNRSSSGNEPLHCGVRSRSGSVLAQRRSEDPQMLIDGHDDDDEDLPEDNQVNITASQAQNRDDIPDAFQPDMLATLEKQCRAFLSFVEERAADQDEAGIQFEDIVPLGSFVKVAAIGFYNCLTLATKQLLRVDQPQPWGVISLTLAA